MTSRERWTIYPLLFLAIGMAARDKIATPTESTFRLIRCQQLIVQNVNGQPLVQMGTSSEGYGVIELVRSSEDASATNKAPESALEISANEQGGYVTAYGTKDRPGIVVGYRPQEEFGGLMALDAENALVGEEQAFPSKAWGVHCRIKSQE